MMTMSRSRVKNPYLAVLDILLVLTAASSAATDNWQREDVDWRAGGGKRIAGIYVPQAKSSPRTLQTRIGRSESGSPAVAKVAASAETDQVDSPPVEGFTVHIAVVVTDARSVDDFDCTALPQSSLVGNFLTVHPQTDYAMGVFDTGGSFHLVGYDAAERMGVVAAGLLSPYRMDLLGAMGSASVWLSRPLAMFVDGLAAIDPNTLTLTYSNVVGQSNVVVAVGSQPHRGAAGLGTAIGAPLGVNFAAAIFNDR